ncbi:porin [Acinetobacter sp. TTH0-4]|uniref:porin n=1 Tax=Acinetobacter sp. TTH0-4 TaxID=1646498 RepID=UPI0006ADF30F|nr:porin [Acinetobacter sp. TTH0-4]ALD00889.1 porin [Acinetobacter sp. TTH0-4]
MKKLLLATAVAALGMSAAQAAPTLYGKLNVSIDQVDNYDFKGNDVSEVSSHASRLGVKGEEKLTDNLSAVYQAEWAVSTDGEGSDTDWSARNRFLGLKWAGIGTLKAGQYDSYFKTSAGNAQDIFNDHTRLDMTKVLHGEERLKNVIGFETDKKLLGGVQFSIMAQQGENTASQYTTEVRDGFGDAVSTSLSYDNKDLGLALAVAANMGVQGDYAAYGLKDVESDAVRVTGSYNFKAAGLSGLTLGALWQQAELSDSPSATVLAATVEKGLKPEAASLEEQAMGITAAYKFADTPWTVKAEYITAETTATGVKDRTIDQYGLGVDYHFNKQARMYGVVASQERDWETGVGKDDTMTVFGLGMEYNF